MIQWLIVEVHSVMKILMPWCGYLCISTSNWISTSKKVAFLARSLVFVSWGVVTSYLPWLYHCEVRWFAVGYLVSQHLFRLSHNFNVIQNAKCCMSQMDEIWYSTNSSIKTLVDLNNQFYFMFQWALKANMVSCYILAREQCLPAMGLYLDYFWAWSYILRLQLFFQKGKENSTSDTMKLQN